MWFRSLPVKEQVTVTLTTHKRHVQFEWFRGALEVRIVGECVTWFPPDQLETECEEWLRKELQELNELEAQANLTAQEQR